MSHTPDSNRPVVYEIRLAGHLPARWSAWFEGLAMTTEPDGSTRLTGPLVDQAALYGLLKKVRDLGPLVSVNPVRIDETHPSHSQKEKKMTTLNQPTEKETVRIPVQMKLSALWASLMFLYIYADFLSLYKPGQMEEAMAGRMGPLPVTQGSVLAAAVLMLIPALMIFLSVALKPVVGRWANIVLGLLYTAVNIGNLVGETWAFYLLFGIVEIALTLLIVGYAWRWRSPRAD